jgi:tetratricopeptide (TPR) repeat protein
MRDEPQQPAAQPELEPQHEPQRRKAARDVARSVTAAKPGAKSRSGSAAQPAATPAEKPAEKPKPKHTTRHSTRQSGKQPPQAAPQSSLADVDGGMGLGGFDPRMMERQMAALTRLLEAQGFESEEQMQAFIEQLNTQDMPLSMAPATPLEEAQDLIYEASGLHGKRREALIRKALAISPDCADAYLLLAESCRDINQARDYFEQGVQAGERAIGPAMFKQLAADGAFWGYLETRPYMRAREGLASILWEQDEHTAAIEHMRALLQLNPNDNQGLRFRLTSWLLTTGDDLALKRAADLLKQFKEDDSAFMVYSRLLLALRTKGAGPAAEKALETALKSNPYVPLYLLGVLPPPTQQPDYYGVGDQNEAIIYLEEGGVEAWAARDEDIAWLIGAMIRHGAPGLLNEQTEPRRHHKRPPKVK